MEREGLSMCEGFQSPEWLESRVKGSSAELSRSQSIRVTQGRQRGPMVFFM